MALLTFRATTITVNLKARLPRRVLSRLCKQNFTSTYNIIANFSKFVIQYNRATWPTDYSQSVQQFSAVNTTFNTTGGCCPCAACRPTGQRNDFELIPTVKMGTEHAVEGPFGREFSSVYIVSEVWGPEVASR